MILLIDASFGQSVLRVLGAGRSESLIIKPAKELYVDVFHVLMEERGGGDNAPSWASV